VLFLIYKNILFDSFLLDKNIYIVLLVFLFNNQLVNEFEPDKLLQSDYWFSDQKPASAPATNKYLSILNSFWDAWNVF
jgi:hypothetical protein